jgi:hypothetical protein
MHTMSKFCLKLAEWKEGIANCTSIKENKIETNMTSDDLKVKLILRFRSE